MGFSLTMDGHVAVHPITCSAETTVVEVRVADTHTKSVEKLDRAKETTIWKVNASSPEVDHESIFVVGEPPPPGWVVEQPGAEPGGENFFRVYVVKQRKDGSRYETRELLRIATLQVGSIRVKGKNLSSAEFEEYSHGSACA
ncbi:MAG: hypothetical protein HY875_05020 [Chloroflexi bacterium]|nr:hypothetical protein [Chloroflexota bacterium]